MTYKIEPYANLRGANLRGANLRGANLREADLRRANLREADLCGANLYDAILRGANLRGANLRGANLREADLCGANLYDANLTSTCLDPMTAPNGNINGFKTIDEGQWVVGYRSKDSPQIGGPPYQVGEIREAPVFSTDDTECHPGIFVCPTIEAAQKWGDEIVKVIFWPWECHHAGEKHRVKWLIVWEDVK